MARARVSDAVELRQLADQQAALRRIATEVARGGPPDDLFALVAEQVALVLEVPVVGIARYEDEHTISARASFSAGGEVVRVGRRWPLDGTNVVGQVLATGRAVRIDDYGPSTGEIAETVHQAGVGASVGIPIAVAGRLWGAMVASSPEPLPEGIEERLADFTELLATAIANAEARDELSRLAEEQGALRRVATLVAEDVPAEDLFAAVAEEVGLLLEADLAGLIRYVSGDTVTPMATWDANDRHPDVQGEWPLKETGSRRRS